MTEPITPRPSNRLTGLGVALVLTGLAFHLLAARAIGGTHLAFRDHIAGFVGIAMITGAILALIGWRFWRERRDITILVFGAVQAAFGLLVYMMRFSVHG
ncbi:MAG: hypothetical protein M3Y05_00885 [Gemmatimonadota bacterium]|nr:hypothetical protein [Gemmatimonadota bacterium]